MAGAGMYLGWRQADNRGGVVAAGIAIFGIVAAKVVILAWFIGPPGTAVAAAPATSKPAEKEDSRVIRLASHRAHLAVQHAGNQPADTDAFEQAYEPEAAKYREMTDDELEKAMSELSAWEAEGKWKDKEYVHDALAYHLALKSATKAQGKEVPADEDEPEEIPPEQWKTSITEAKAKVEKMKTEACVAELKRIEAEQERQQKEWRLAYHRAELQASSLGLPYKSDKRGVLLSEQQGEVHRMSDGELDTAITALESWEKTGKWADKDWVRNELIYREIKDAYETERGGYGGPGVYALSEAEWRPLYNKAAAKVDRMPPDQRVFRLQVLQKESEMRLDAKLAELRKEADAGDRYARGDLLGAIVKSLLKPIQLLFIGLAAASAFRVASNGFSFGGEQ